MNIIEDYKEKQRNRMIELIENAPVWKNSTKSEACAFLTDHLIENGVILLPVKVGGDGCG